MISIPDKVYKERLVLWIRGQGKTGMQTAGFLDKTVYWIRGTRQDWIQRRKADRTPCLADSV